MTEKEYDDVEQDFWKFENDGDSVAGVYISKEENVGENDSNVYNLNTVDGIKSVWGSTVLDSKMKLASFGEDIRIVFVGKVKPDKGREYKDFKLQKVKKE